VEAALEEDRYIPLDAEDMLAKVMVNGWPDGQRFANLLGRVMKKAVAGHRRTRAFGETVALLWAHGQTGATVRLEDLWNQFCRSYSFPLLCSYPKAGFTKRPLRADEICAAHSRLITGSEKATGWITPIAAQAAD
jgi:hypothetical protein